MKQVDAVFKAICQVRNTQSFDSAVELTNEEKKIINQMIADGIWNREIEFSEKARAKYETKEKVSHYVTGLINNHVRKDKRLNGDTKYEPKNPGSRAGQGDAVLKELRKLLTVCDDDTKEQVQAAIDERLQELKASKVKEVEINLDLLPESLRKFAS